MTVQLPDLPARIAKLPKDERGYPVPWFVHVAHRRRQGGLATAAGAPAELRPRRPDFRYADFAFRAIAFKTACAGCAASGSGRHEVYAIGPMCVINRVTMEPASHRECAEFSARACPFLTRPKEKRNVKGLAGGVRSPGMMITRNPGCVALYETPLAKPFSDGKAAG